MKAMRGRIALPKHYVRKLLRTTTAPHGRGCGVGRSLGIGVGRGVEVGVGVGLTVGVGVGLTVGVGVGVGVMDGVGVAEGVAVGVASDMKGAGTSTVTGEPVLKKPMVAVPGTGAALESNRKLYNVPHRIAFAFGFCAMVSVLQVRAEPLPKSTVQGVLLYPASPTVPSCAHPGCCGGAWNWMLLSGTGNPKKT
jgi:hypothetical protein